MTQAENEILNLLAKIRELANKLPYMRYTDPLGFNNAITNARNVILAREGLRSLEAKRKDG